MSETAKRETGKASRVARAKPIETGGQRIGRRTMVKAGGLGALGITLPQYFSLQEARSEFAAPARAESVLLIYAMGGISHLDTFDPKPNAPSEVRGEFKTISTRLPGVSFTDQVPLLAQHADRFALLRSVQHHERDHGVAAYYMLRGYTQPTPAADRPENQQNTNPNIGSHVARVLGSHAGLPPYICVPALSYLAQINYYTAGWSGRAHDPFLLKSDPNETDFRLRDLALYEISAARLKNRVALKKLIDNQRRRIDSYPNTGALSRHQAQALQILTSEATQRAFDISAETESVRDSYGRSRLGQSCLLARRLVQAGVPFVTVDDDGWDHHADVFPGLRNRLPELDRCFSTLLVDLDQRGLLSSTLVILLTDFGRTPQVNGSAGRDHWPNVFSVLCAGAGIRGGQVIGASDKIGGEPLDSPITPKDIAATIYRFLGLDPFQEYAARDGRTMKMLDKGTPIPALL